MKIQILFRWFPFWSG